MKVLLSWLRDFAPIAELVVPSMPASPRLAITLRRPPTS